MVIGFWVAIFQLVFFVAALAAGVYLVGMTAVGIYLTYGWELFTALFTLGGFGIFLMCYRPKKTELGEIQRGETFMRKAWPPEKEFTLWQSDDDGKTYWFADTADRVEDLIPTARQLDAVGRRWMVDNKLGELSPTVVLSDSIKDLPQGITGNRWMATSEG